MPALGELAIGDHFILNNEEYEKIHPIRKSCCSNYTARKISDDSNVALKPDTQVELKTE